MPHLHRPAAVTAGLLALTLGAATASAAPTAPLGQVNDDPANSIDPGRSAGVSDVVGGALTAGALPIPWATFEQTTAGAQQVFVRAFKDGAWKTEGFPASLNIDTTEDAEAPAIDFAGPNRTVPWATWYEPSKKLAGGKTNIFASRFSAATNVWIPEGQDRAAPNKIPSLNIHTDRTAENPAIAGGTTTAGANPGPWVAWEENDGGATDATAKRQIFVSKPIVSKDCSANAPGGGTSVSAFCWQQTGFKRLAAGSIASSSTGDPTLNIDPSRDGIEPDIAFTGPNDTVPWVVWYEQGASGLGGRGNAQVFAAKGVADATADGGIKWIAEGAGTAGQGTANTLDRSATKSFGNCLSSTAQEDKCSLNRVPTDDAIDPRVAAGSLAPGGATVPFVTWAEDNGSGVHQIFVSRLVGGDHFELLNGGQPISNTVNDSIRPDITFSGNTPYVTWQENVGGVVKVFSSHLEGAKFVLDTPGGIAQDPSGVQADLRAPVSSGCTANPFTADGAACPSGAAGTPFFLFTDRAADPHPLLGRAYEPSAVTTGGASGISTSGATVSGSVNPGGGTVRASFQFGTSTAYGQETAAQRLAPATAPTSFSAALGGLPAGTVVHYRSVVRTDFGTVAGPDQTLTTVAAPTPPAATPPTPGASTPGGTVKKPAADRSLPVMGLKFSALSRGRTRLTLRCPASEARCRGTITLTAKGSKKKVARATFSLRGGQHKTLTVRISSRTRAALRRKRVKTLVLAVRTTDTAGNTVTQKRSVKLR